MSDFARPNSEIQGINVNPIPTPGQGLALGPDGKLPIEMQMTRVSTITSGTTFTALPLTRSLFVECIGGGGGGGGCPTTGAGECVAGGGGGGGAYSSVWVTSNGVHAIAIGSGGAGIANAFGAPGGDTSFKNALGAIVCLAKAGTGGGAVVGAVAFAPVMIGAPAGGGPAASGIGDVKYDGGDGFWGQYMSVTNGTGGVGGAAACGGPGVSGGLGGSNGNNGKAYGGGGSGGSNSQNQLATRKGGDGAGGLIRVWEFI